MRKRYSNRLRFRRAAALFLKRAVFIAAVFLAVYFIPKAAGGVLSGGDYVHFSDSLGTFLLKTGLNRSYELPGFSPLSFFFPNIKPAPSGSASPAPDSQQPQSPDDSSEDEAPVKQAPEDDGSIIPTTITGEGSSRYPLSGGIYFNNKTDYDIDGDAVLAAGCGIELSSSPQVLIIHTHGSEAYHQAGEDVYTPSDPSRTEDKNFNMVRVGNELAEVFESRGISVIHDTNLYDYPTYTGSYNRSLESIEKYLEEYPSIKIVLDIHRDALEGDGTTYKVVADKLTEPCAQVMIVCGTDFNGLEHSGWRENLSFAALLQKRASEKYPSLMRPLTVSGSRYNQHATSGSLIIEIGTNGNTLQEALCAARYFGDAAADVISGLK